MKTEEKDNIYEWSWLFDQGFSAGELGKSQNDCPYALDTEAAGAWLFGFEEALAQKEVRKVYLEALESTNGGMIPFYFLIPASREELRNRIFEDGWIPGVYEGMELAGTEFRA